MLASGNRRSMVWRGEALAACLRPQQRVGEGSAPGLPAHEQCVAGEIGIDVDCLQVRSSEQTDEFVNDDRSRHLVERTQHVGGLREHHIGDTQGLVTFDHLGADAGHGRRIVGQVANQGRGVQQRRHALRRLRWRFVWSGRSRSSAAARHASSLICAQSLPRLDCFT